MDKKMGLVHGHIAVLVFPHSWSFSPSSFTMDTDTNMDYKSDTREKVGNFTFDDILDGIFSQEEMDAWKTEENSEKIVRTKDKQGFFLILVNNFSYLPVIAVTTCWVLQFSPWSCYSASVSFIMVFTITVIHLALFK